MIVETYNHQFSSGDGYSIEKPPIVQSFNNFTDMKILLFRIVMEEVKILITNKHGHWSGLFRQMV